MKILITGGSGFIGTNFIEYCGNNYSDIMNIDIKEPNLKTHYKYWTKCDILNEELLTRTIIEYQPNLILHLAARVDVLGKTLEDYEANTVGTANLLKAIKKQNTIDRIIITSTQIVHQADRKPCSYLEYYPLTKYGESKVITEKLTRDANINCAWTIIRPTNIWGPWHWRYPFEFWKVIADGKYLHPKTKTKIIRNYGYVNNVNWQIKKILEMPIDEINEKTFYVGDLPIELVEWVDMFSLAQTGKDTRHVNIVLLKIIAKIGDTLNQINYKFPLTSSRLKSMTNSNYSLIEDTFKLLGAPPFSLQEGVDQTIAWMKEYHPCLISKHYHVDVNS